MPIGFPRRRVSPVGLIAHTVHFGRTPRANSSRYGPGEQDSMILYCSSGFAAVLAFARRQEVPLPASGRERAGVFAAHAEQHDLGDVPEIEADAPAVGA